MTCTLCTTALKTALNTALPAAAALAFISLAAPAEASTQTNLAACKAQLVLDGHIDAERDRVSFDSSKRNKIKLNIEADDHDDRLVTCKIRRGKIVSLSEGGDVLLAKTAAPADTTGN